MNAMDSGDTCRNCPINHTTCQPTSERPSARGTRVACTSRRARYLKVVGLHNPGFGLPGRILVQVLVEQCLDTHACGFVVYGFEFRV